MLQILIESISLILAFVFGIYSYKFMNQFSRLLFVQLCFWIFFYFFSYVLLFYQTINNFPKNNHWLFNISMVFETFFLLSASYIYFIKVNLKRLPAIFLVIFFSLFLFEIHIRGYVVFANYSYIAESFCLITMYILILYDQFEKHPFNWYKAPKALISVGILVYFICNVPYLSLMNYFQKFHPNFNRILFHLVK